jgi:hypothetical protein
MNINKTNYENYFLLYIDKELSASDQAAVESFVHENPPYANELASLQKATLNAGIDADKIIYPNKALLYRLPEMEATLSANFKNKLYKQPTTILQPNFKMKASLLSVAAMFIVLIGYRWMQADKTIVSKSGSTVAHAATLPAASANESASKAIAATNKLIADEFITDKSTITKVIHPRQLIAINNPIATIETATIIDQEATPIITEAQQNYISPISDNASEKNEMPATETFAEEQSHKEAKEYKVIDTDETDRTIYIANFEIDGATFRGITRRVSALLKRNKIEKEK